jgi:hypothetical protein
MSPQNVLAQVDPWRASVSKKGHIDVEVGTGKTTLRTHLFGCVRFRESKVSLKLRDNVKARAHSRRLADSLLSIDLSALKSTDNRGKMNPRSVQASPPAAHAEAACQDKSRSRIPAFVLFAPDSFEQLPSAGQEIVGNGTTFEGKIVIRDRAVVHHQSREMSGAVLGDDPVKRLYSEKCLPCIGVKWIESGL